MGAARRSLRQAGKALSNRLGRAGPSPESERKVLRGRDGWLFLQNDTNDSIGQLTGRRLLTAEEAAAWEDTLRSRASRLRELGITWAQHIAPEKHSVYPEHLPPEIAAAPKRPVNQYATIARAAGAAVHYPVPDLEAEKGRGLLYSRVDSHWNQLGAYLVYRGICDELRRGGVAVEPLGEDAIEWVERTHHRGDLGVKLPESVSDVYMAAELREHAGRLVFDNGVLHHGAVMIFESPLPAPRAVVVGESFTNHLLLFLKETFGRIVFVHTSSLDQSLLEAERPDVVITVPTERFLVRVPSDEDARAALEDTVRRKRERGAMRDMRFYDLFLTGIPGAAEARASANEAVIPW